MATPRSVRFDPDVLERLNAYVKAHPGLSVSTLTNRFVDEALRMEAHPGIFFREGPAGRRAVLVGGPDVWEVIRAVKSVRANEPGLSADEVVELVAQDSGVPARLLRVAIDYWAAYPDEIDEWIKAADEAERDAYEQWQRRQKLLAS
jgi:hypothetical protein